MSQYLSYSLVHAHLPTPPSIPDSIPQIHLDPNEDVLSSSSSSGPHFVEHATSFSLERDINVLARVIHNGHVLELRAFDTVIRTNSTDTTSAGSQTLRIVFPVPLAPLAEDSIVNSLHDRKIYVFAYTTTNVLYRLSFPFTGQTGPGTRCSFTTERSSNWVEIYQVPEDVISSSSGVSTWIAVDEETVVLGGRDGGIIRLTRNGDASWSATHHRVQSRFLSLFSSSASSEQVLSFARFDTEDTTLLYTLCRDRRLRIWDAHGGVALRTIDIKPSSSREVSVRPSQTPSRTPTINGSDSDVVPSVRVVRHPEPSSRISHLVIVYLASSNNTAPGTFIVYRVSRAGQELGEVSFAEERECSWDSVGLSLRGFEIAPPSPSNSSLGWRLWAAWDAQGTLAADSVLMDDIFQFTTYFQPSIPTTSLYEWQRALSDKQVEQYDPAYFDNLLGVDPPNPSDAQDHSDITQTFIEHLFHPGRFSILSLTTVLDDYIASLPRDQSFPQITLSTYSSLAAKFAAIVGCNIPLNVNPQTGAPEIQTYRVELKLQWLGIWAAVRNLDAQARWPIGTTKVGEQVSVITREGISIPIAQDSASVVANSDREEFRVDQFEDLPETALVDSYPDLETQSARERSIIVSSTGAYLADRLYKAAYVEDNGNALDVLVDRVNTYLALPPSEPVEIVAGQLWDEYVEPYLSEEDLESARALLDEAGDVVSALQTVLQILSTLDFASPITLDDDLRFSGLGDALLTAGVSATISSRHKLARGTLLVSVFFVATLAVTADEAEGEVLIRLLSRIFATYHRYRVLQWASEQPADETRAQSLQLRRLTKRHGGQEPYSVGAEQEEDVENVDRYDTSYSLIHSLLARSLSQPVPTGPSGTFPPAVSSFLSWASSVTPSLWDTTPTEKDVAFAFAVLEDGQPKHAGMLAALYPPSAPMLYIKGRAYLDIGEIDDSVIHFERAASGCRSGLLELLIPNSSGSRGLTTYYRHITRLYEDQGVEAPIVRFGRLALQSTSPDDPAVTDIWTKVFLANLSLGAYEDAYVTLTSTPHLDVKKDFLGQLISHMCEANQVGRLNSLGFVGLQKEVEELLAFKAKHSDPLRPPNYHQVLYSWHVTRSDYRSAAHVMYNQAKRLEGSHRNSQYTTYDVTVKQARSYLAAINAMSLLDKKQAWIAFPLPPSAFKRAVKRRKITSYIPEKEFAADKPALEILTLEDIQAEYTAVLSRLQLAPEIPDILGTAAEMTIEPEELVGFFVQRGMYDEALSSASTLQLDMTDIFISLAQRCVQLNRLNDLASEVESPTSYFLFTSPLTSRLRGPPSALALRYLQLALGRHDSAKTQFRYRRAVSDELFKLNNDARSGWRMPVWLVDWEMDRDPEGWITMALEHGWISEALGWCLDLLRRETPPELLPKNKSMVTYTPFSLFARVIAATHEGPEKDDKDVQAKARELREATDQRIDGLKKIKL